MAPRINLPLFTRILLLVNIGLSAINASIRLNKWRNEDPTAHPPNANYLSNPALAVPYLALVPLKSLRYPWTFVTAAWVENNIVSMAISAAVICFGGKYLERAWGSREFGKFVLFVTLIPNLLGFCIYGFWHGVVGTPEFPTPIQGLLPLEAAFLVALKQLVPEHTVSLFNAFLRIRIKHFPALFTLANIISGPLLGTDTALWLSLFGFLTGWVYLRFYRITENMSGAATGGEGMLMRGDASDTFAFVAFFPDAMHAFVAPVCDAVYSILVAVKVCTPFSDEAVETGNESAAARSEGLPGITDGPGGSARRAEAERRRALALKALDQRLSAAAAGRVASAPVTIATTTAAPAVVGDGTEAAGGEEDTGRPVQEAQASAW